MHQPNFSIGLLISTYNWPQALELILKNIHKQTLQPTEILIADDGSGYETQKVIEKYTAILPQPIKHAWHEDRGFRKSIILNKAIKLATADYIIEIDGDIVLHRRFIEDHIKNAEPDTFVQGARAMVTKQTTYGLLNGKIDKLSFFSRGIKSRFNSLRLPFLRKLVKEDAQSYKNIKACNIAYWRNDYVKINGYNNTFFGWGWEDYEIAARLINAGIKKKRLKLSAICFHLHHKVNSREYKEQNKIYFIEAIEKKLTYCVNGYNEV